MKPPYDYRIFDYDKSILPSKWLRIHDSEASALEEVGPTTGLSMGHPGWGMLYHVALCMLSPVEDNLILETGTNYGASTIVLAQALKDSKRSGRIVTVEISDVNYTKALSNFDEAGVADVIDAYNRDSIEFLSEFQLSKEEIPAIFFIDGSHSKNDVILEIDLCRKINAGRNPNCLYIFDNTSMGGVREAMQLLGGKQITLPYVSWHPTGMTLWQE